MQEERQFTSYVDWSAILVGSVLACAVSLILLQFGAGVGLVTELDKVPEGASNWKLFVGALWTVVVALTATGIGAYVAGRLRPRHPDATEDAAEFRDGIHGVAVWAIATLVVASVTAITATIAALAGAAAMTANEASAADDAQLRALAANVTLIVGFGTAAGSAVAAALAWFAAVAGGSDRDENVPLTKLRPSPWPARD